MSSNYCEHKQFSLSIGSLSFTVFAGNVGSFARYHRQTNHCLPWYWLGIGHVVECDGH